MLCHFLVIAHVIFFLAVPVPGDNITPPLYISTESCAPLIQAEWQQIYPDLSTQQNIISLDIVNWHYLLFKAKQALWLLKFWLLSFVLCFGDQSICLNRFWRWITTGIFRVWGPLRLTPIDGSLSSKSVKQIIWSSKHNKIDTSKTQEDTMPV